MKKLTLASLIMATMSAGAFAATAPAAGDTDAATAGLKWSATLPIVVDGQWMTLTGQGGTGSLVDGVLNINNDGTFSSDEIVLEVRNYDEETGATGDLFDTKTNSAKLHYSVEQVNFNADRGTDVSGVIGKVKEAPFGVVDGVGVDNDANVTSWLIANANGEALPTLVGGEKVTAEAVIRVDATYIATAP